MLRPQETPERYRYPYSLALMESPIKLGWTFGVSTISGSVISLNDGSRNALFYAAAQMGVVYDYSTRGQRHLQGHSNAISCAVVSQNKKWLVTADTGNESIVVIWDSASGNPVRVINSPPWGVLSIDISTDATFIALLSDSKGPDGDEQELVIWDWQTRKNTPLFSACIPPPHKQTCVRFNVSDLHELVTNSSSSVHFWSCEETMSCYAPRISQRSCGNSKFTVSTFLPRTTQAATATVDGCIILWDVPAMMDKADSKTNFIGGSSDQRVVSKVIRLCNGAITCLTTFEMYLIVAGNDGAVRIYDLLFRLEAWFEDLNAGPVTSISFSRRLIADISESHYASSKMTPAPVPDMLVGTESAAIIDLRASVFEAVHPEDRQGVVLVQGMANEVHCVSLHPTQSLLLIACSGALYLWDYASRSLKSLRLLNASKMHPHCTSFDQVGLSLAVGTAAGDVRMLDPINLADTGALLKGGKTKIRLLEFSQDSKWLAAADAGCSVALWRQFTLHTDVHATMCNWTYIGRYSAHSMSIRGLQFGGQEGNVTLFSVAEDKTLVEYNLTASTVATGVSISGVYSVEESATPTACLWHPMTNGGFEDRVITANSEFKLRQWNADNKLCRRTSLGPSFGGACTQLVTLGTAKAQSNFLAYAAKSRVAGIIKLPLDGNPNKTMGVIVHPDVLSALVATACGKRIFTAGGRDQTVNCWRVQKHLVDALEATGGAKMEPYLALLPLNNNEKIYERLVDSFYYLQLRNQEKNATSLKTPGTIPLSDVSRLMRGVGFYPSDQDIFNIISEAKYSSFTLSGQTTEDVDIGDFIKLLVNHRPSSDITMGQVCRALEHISIACNGPLSGPQWQIMLETHGEIFSSQELRASLHALDWDLDNIDDRISVSELASRLGFSS